MKVKVSRYVKLIRDIPLYFSKPDVYLLYHDTRIKTIGFYFTDTKLNSSKT